MGERPRLEDVEGLGTLHLQRRLEGVDGGEGNAPRGASGGRERGLRGDGHVGRELAEGHEDTGVGRGVSEAGEGVLDDGEGDEAQGRSNVSTHGIHVIHVTHVIHVIHSFTH